MKANQTKQRIYSLFSHPSARFAKAVGDIADRHIAELHAVTDGGTIDGPDDTLLAADNVDKIFNIAESFTVVPGDNRFVEVSSEEITYPAGSNVLVVDASTADDPEPVYKFDILRGIAAAGGGAQMLRYESEGTSITVEEGVDLKNNLVSVHAYVECYIGSEEVFSEWADGLCSFQVEDERNVNVKLLPCALGMIFDEIPEGAVINVTRTKAFVLPS